MEENPYKAPTEFDPDRNDKFAPSWFRATLSRFPAHFWYWILSLFAAHIALTVLFVVLQVRGLPYALLKPYHDKSLYAIIALWGLASLVMATWRIRKLIREGRHLRSV